jgi:hypothetical protein
MGVEHAALAKVWPTALVVYCTFHVLQAIWRWLFNPNHHIRKENRLPLFNAYTKLFYFEPKTTEELRNIDTIFDKAVQEFEQNPFVKNIHNKPFLKYLQTYHYLDKVNKDHVRKIYPAYRNMWSFPDRYVGRYEWYVGR